MHSQMPVQAPEDSDQAAIGRRVRHDVSANLNLNPLAREGICTRDAEAAKVLLGVRFERSRRECSKGVHRATRNWARQLRSRETFITGLAAEPSMKSRLRRPLHPFKMREELSTVVSLGKRIVLPSR